MAGTNSEAAGFSGRIFCPKCGTRIDLMPGARFAACPECGHVVRLPERTPEQLEQERRAAAMAADAMAMANEALRQAEEATRQAQQMAQAQAEAAAAAQAELEARERARAEAERQAQARAEAERQAQAQAEQAARARAEAERQARARAEEEARAQERVASRSRACVGVEADGSVRDRATGYGLFRGTFPAGWKVVGTSLQRMGSSSRPYLPQVELRDVEGGVIRVTQGEAGIRNSKAMQAMFAMYGQALVGVSTVNYADVPDPLQACDELAAQYLTQMGAQNTQRLGQLDEGNLESLLQRAFARLQNQARQEGMSVSEPFVASVLRVYAFEMGGAPWRMASYVLLEAAKANMMGDGLNFMTGGLMDGIGKLFGGGSAKEQPATQHVEQRGAWDRANGPRWCLPEMGEYTRGGTIVWSLEQLSMMAAPADVFDERMQRDFLPLVHTVETHSDVLGLAMQVVRHETAMVQQSTQNTIAMKNAQFQAQQAAMRQQQAAFDSQLEQWHRNSDAHHQAFRERTNAQFNTPVGGGGSPDFSEAIRGVNTFVRSDGTEVELDVSADVAYENQAGDVIGGATGFDPGADWTQIPQR